MDKANQQSKTKLLFISLALTAILWGLLPMRAAHAVCPNPVTVTNNNDSGAGSLRDAIASVCTGGTINFNGDYTITLVSTLTIAQNLTIDGTGYNVTVSGNNAVGVFTINSGVTATLNNLTITNGSATVGGGIYNSGTLTVTNSTLSGNNAGASYPGGGGIYNSGTVTVTNSTLSGNNNLGGGGGGIHNNNGMLTVTNSTLSGNCAAGGGGILNYPSGTVTVTNSTLSGNCAGGGGGILNSNGTVTVTNSTLSGNYAVNSGGGGGIYNYTGTATVTNSIIANSTAGGNCGGSSISGSNNLADDSSCVAGFTNSPTIQLGPLADNGGPTQTFALLPGSSAINAGDDTVCGNAIGSPLYGAGGIDQRGVTRPQGTQCDIGAYEVATNIVVVSAVTGGNITLNTTTPGCSFIGWGAKTAAQVVSGGDPSYTYPYGLVEFKLNCAAADVTLTFPGSITGTTYRKYGPTTPGNAGTTIWYTFNNVTVNSSTSITLHLTDGGLGDDTGVDGLIVDQGGPGLLGAGNTAIVPTMTEWGMIIFMLLAGLGAVYYLGRQKRV